MQSKFENVTDRCSSENLWSTLMPSGSQLPVVIGVLQGHYPHTGLLGVLATISRFVTSMNKWVSTMFYFRYNTTSFYFVCVDNVRPKYVRIIFLEQLKSL